MLYNFKYFLINKIFILLKLTAKLLILLKFIRL